MGRGRNISSDLPRTASRSRVRSARVSKKDAANKSARSRSGSRPPRALATVKSSEEPLVIERFDSVWEALGFPPEEAANLEMRSLLMIQIREIIRKRKWTQATAARHCGISQPRINDLLRGRIDKFSIDALVNMAASLGQKVHIQLKAA